MNILLSLAGETNINIDETISNYNINFLVAIDGGIKHINKFPIDLLVGDMDSINNKEQYNIKEEYKLNPIKDETDFQVALNIINQRFPNSNIYVIGFLSKFRVEHFYANLKLMQNNIQFIEQNTRISLLNAGEYLLKQNQYQYYSFFPKSPEVAIQLKGFKYEYNGNLQATDIIGISNEFEKEAEVKVLSGEIYMFESKDECNTNR